MSLVLSDIGREHAVSPLEALTWVPLDVQSVARIIDSLVDDERVTRSDDMLVQWLGEPVVTQDPPDVRRGEHLKAGGFVENLVTLRGDQDWCRKVRDQHLVLRAIATIGPTSDLDKLADRADIPPVRVRAVLGDFEAEGFIAMQTDDDGIDVTAPDIEYPPERFSRNEALLTDVEERAVPVQRVWWIILGVAAVGLILFIASRIATSLAS